MSSFCSILTVQTSWYIEFHSSFFTFFLKTKKMHIIKHHNELTYFRDFTAIFMKNDAICSLHCCKTHIFKYFSWKLIFLIHWNSFKMHNFPNIVHPSAYSSIWNGTQPLFTHANKLADANLHFNVNFLSWFLTLWTFFFSFQTFFMWFAKDSHGKLPFHCKSAHVATCRFSISHDYTSACTV